MSRAELRDLAELTNITLDGKPASVVGWSAQYLWVRQFNGYGFIWSDEAIERVLNNGGRFESD